MRSMRILITKDAIVWDDALTYNNVQQPAPAASTIKCGQLLGLLSKQCNAVHQADSSSGSSNSSHGGGTISGSS